MYYLLRPGLSKNKSAMKMSISEFISLIIYSYAKNLIEK